MNSLWCCNFEQTKSVITQFQMLENLYLLKGASKFHKCIDRLLTSPEVSSLHVVLIFKSSLCSQLSFTLQSLRHQQGRQRAQGSTQS